MDNQRGSENEKIPPLRVEVVQNETQDEAFKEEFIKDLTTIVEGEIIEGSVIAVTADSVFIDIGYKSEGEIPLSDFTKKPKKGDSVRVMVLNKENREGRLVLSKKKADEIFKWDNLVKSYKEGFPVEGKIIETIKGGFTVDVDGYKAFLPFSQIFIKKTDNPSGFIDKIFSFKIDRLNGKSNIILSHRKFLEEQREKSIEEFFNLKKEGDIVEGIVKDIVNYGAFIDLGSIDGLLHINDMSWGRVSDPKKYIKKGEELKIKILSIDLDNRKVSLGLKQMVPNPWESFEEKYKKSEKYKGKVTKITSFGGFIELEEGIEGLLHVSELSWTKRINHPKEILKQGDIVEVMVLDYNLNKRTVSLGLKQVLPNPWDTVDVRYPIGSRISVNVARIMKSGLFVELEEGIEGFLHIDDISWTKHIKNLSSSFKKGDSIETVVLEIDKENQKIKLGLKQLIDNPWTTLKSKYPKGSIITGNITSITDFGVFIKIDKEIEGLIHLSQLSNEKIENPNEQFKVGDEIKAMVIDIDEEKKRVSLSVKELINKLEEKEIQKYIEDDPEKTASVTLGEIIDLTNIGK